MAVKVRPIADFTADFPQDSVEEDGEIVILGGRGVAEHIAAILGRLDYLVAAPEHSPPYGWRFDASAGSGRVTIQIADLGEEYVLDVIERTSFFARLFNSNASIRPELLTKLHRELSQDGRFHNIQWWDRYDGHGVAASEPVTA